MKKVVNVVEVKGEGLIGLMGERVLLMCASYFYTGKLAGVNDTCVLLEDAFIVYETGKASNKVFQNQEALPGPWYVRTASIESYGAVAL